MRQALVGLAIGLGAGAAIGFAIGAATRGGAPAARTADGAHAPTAAARPGEGARRAGADRPGPAAPQPRDRRARTRGTPPSRPSEDASSARTQGEILRDPAAALRAEEPRDAADVDHARTLSAGGPPPEIDISLMDLALSRSREFGDTAHALALAAVVRPDAALAALEAALSGTHPRRMDVVYNLACGAASIDRDATGTATVMLAHADARVRAAGVMLASSLDALPVATLLNTAQRDIDGDVRSEALDALMSRGAWDDDDDDLRSAVAPAVLLAAREGPADARRVAISWFPELGAQAADTALTLLREGGLDEELAEFVVAPILASGRGRDLLDSSPSRIVLDAARTWIEEREDLVGAELRALFPVIHAVLPLQGAEDDYDYTYAILGALANAGEFEELERIAGDGTLAGGVRATAVRVLLTPDATPVLGEPEAARRGLRALRGLLDPPSADASARRLAIEGLSYGDAYFVDAVRQAEAIALLRRVARGDPNSWVRAAAQDAVETLLQ